jgi:DNA replication protein DnaC
METKDIKQKLKDLEKQLQECCFTDFPDIQNEYEDLKREYEYSIYRDKLKKQIPTKEQEDIFKSIIEDIKDIIDINMPWDNMISLRGSAGVGKTYTTVLIIKELLKKKYKVTLTTPTHKSLQVAQNMIIKNALSKVDTKTIHSFLNLKLQRDFNTGIQKFVVDELKKEKSKTDILIVDESSMISQDLYQYIDDAIKDQRAKVVLFVGDYYQLPPVDSNSIKIFELSKQYKLSKIVRQAKDSYIIQIASNIRDRIKNKDFINIDEIFLSNIKGLETFQSQSDFLDDFFKKQDWYKKEQIITSYTNKQVDNYNHISREKFWKEKGVNDLNDDIRVGDTVVFQNAHVQKDRIIHQNNEEVKIKSVQKSFDANLEIWFYECIDSEKRFFRVIDKESLIKYNQYLEELVKKAKSIGGKQAKEIWKKFYEIKDKYCEIKYSFASTIHKLQGSTYETVYIDLSEIKNAYLYQDKDFVYRLLYVAVTRASKDIKVLI